jgi:hypothetical protein
MGKVSSVAVAFALNPEVKLFMNISALSEDLFLNRQQKSLNDSPFFFALARSFMGAKNSYKKIYVNIIRSLRLWLLHRV